MPQSSADVGPFELDAIYDMAEVITRYGRAPMNLKSLTAMELSFQPEVVTSFDHQIRFDSDNLDDDKDRFRITKDDLDPDSFFESDIIFINAQRVMEENFSSIFDIKQRF